MKLNAIFLPTQLRNSQLELRVLVTRNKIYPDEHTFAYEVNNLLQSNIWIITPAKANNLTSVKTNSKAKTERILQF